MKGLSIEEKAKAYDIALDKIKRLLGTGSNCSREDLEHVFLELKESEDERISKELLNYLYDVHNDDEERARWITWLKKQGKQKPTFEMKTPEESLGIDSETYNKIVDECIYGDGNESVWSEEDEWCSRQIDYHLYNNDEISDDEAGRLRNWLKSLRPKTTWKPSDEQMNTLEYYMHTLICNKHKEILFGLYADLKKLREE